MKGVGGSILFKSFGSGYFLFITGIFLLGRAFLLISFGYFKGLPLYIADLMMIISFLFLIWRLWLRDEFSFPFWLKSGYFLFWCLSFSYLFSALLMGRVLAVRDIVLSGYMVFGCVTFILLKKLRFSERVLFSIFVLVSLTTIFFYRSRLVNENFLVYAMIDSAKMRLFNMSLYCGLFFAGCLGWICAVESRLLRGIALFLAACFGSLMFACDNRTALLAFTGLLVFFLLYFPYRLRSKIIVLAVIFAGIFTGFICDKQLYSKSREMMRASFESIILVVKKPILMLGRREVSQRQAETVTASIAGAQKDAPARFDKQGSAIDTSSPKTFFTADSKFTLSHSSEQVALRNTELKKIYTDEQFREKVSEKLSNLSWRVDVWRIFLRRAQSSPVLGVGFGVYPDLLSLGILKPRSLAEDSGIVPPHNELITIFYKMGILGLFLYLYMQFYFFRGVRRAVKYLPPKIRVLPAVIMGCLLFWHIMAQSFDLIDSPPTNIILWVLLGVAAWLIWYSDAYKNSSERNLNRENNEG